MMKLTTLLTLGCFSIGVFATDPATEKQESFIAKLLTQQVNQQISVKRSVSALLNRSPEKVESVVKVALDLYPYEYEQIIQGAIEAEAALTCDVIKVVIDSDLATYDEVLEIAILAEPAYATEIINTVAKENPQELENIVRVAMTTEPYISEDIFDTALLSHPERMLDILTGAIKAVPQQVVGLVKSTLAMFPDSGDDVVTTAIRTSDSAHAKQIVDAAVTAGVEEASAIAAAISAGANKEQLAKTDN